MFHSFGNPTLTPLRNTPTTLIRTSKTLWGGNYLGIAASGNEGLKDCVRDRYRNGKELGACAREASWNGDESSQIQGLDISLSFEFFDLFVNTVVGCWSMGDASNQDQSLTS